MAELALILCHKQSTSARLRFVRFDDSVITARLGSADAGAQSHPGGLLVQASERTGLASGDLRLDAEFAAEMLAPAGSASVHLAEITTIDPPFETLERAGGRFITLTEIKGIPDTEREMLRLVYEHMIG